MNYTRTITLSIVVTVAAALGISALGGCHSGPSRECQFLEKTQKKLERFIGAVLAKEGINEPAIIDGKPNPKIFDADGNLKGSADRTEFLLLMGDLKESTRSCEESK